MQTAVRHIERALEAIIFFSRWLIAPFLLGLVAVLVALLFRFFASLVEVIVRLPKAEGHEVLIAALNLVDYALTANLILIVIFSSYESYIRKIGTVEHPDWPDGITHVDFGALKLKLLGSVVAIASVDALAWYLELEKYTETSKLGWVLAFPLVFVVSMLMLAIAERLGRAQKKPPE